MKVIVKLTLAIISILAFVVVIDSMPISTAQTNETEDVLLYDNPNLGFTLEYPSNWTKEESLTFLSPIMSAAIDEAPESIAVTTEVIPSNLTLDDYSSSALSILKGQFPNLKLLETNNSTLSGFPAHQIVYTYTTDGLDLKNMQIWTIVDGMVYAITYGGTINEFNDSLPVIQNMIDSFQITEIQ
jgi:hypothetical protein